MVSIDISGPLTDTSKHAAPRNALSSATGAPIAALESSCTALPPNEESTATTDQSAVAMASDPSLHSTFDGSSRDLKAVAPSFTQASHSVVHEAATLGRPDSIPTDLPLPMGVDAECASSTSKPGSSTEATGLGLF
uniref:AlNc14C233G9333 protein n=1 Tax=Albugo laibachii Nc14 TaxID=890382 RepID=F0WSI9_9STRA|nr:AlNc14C233G9333 [Albugo laibachii Nc14]|eukprot:CCA24314.1 AlNc14C233G9333 [Albugo laibachii Nc14]